MLQVTFIGIYGGRDGAQRERRELAKLGRLFENRQAITELNDLFVSSTACCMTCGMKVRIQFRIVFLDFKYCVP